MREENPAVALYRNWREYFRWRGERHVDQMRRTWQSDLKTDDPDSSGTVAYENIEDKSLSAYRSGHRCVELDYRMRISLVGISDAHLDGRLFNDLDDWEPILSLGMRYRGYTTNLMTLWPDGKFSFESTPAQYHQAFPEFTFLRTSYAAGRRVWMVNSSAFPDHSTGWVNLKEKDWTLPVPYVRNYDLLTGYQYRVVPAENGHWKFAGIENDFSFTHIKTLEEGYLAAERRYARYRKMFDNQERASRPHKVAMYVPRHGLVTGAEAVNRFSQHIRVYEPV